MSAVNGHLGTQDLPEPEDIIARAGLNPLRFLNMSEPDTALGIIRGLDDTEELDAWRDAETEFFDPPRDVILDAIDARVRELTGDSEPEPATDEPSPDPEPTPEPDPTPVHAEVTDVLEPGDVLVVERGPKVEYIWPATDAADEPYVSRVYDDGTLWMELDVDTETVERRRRNNEHAIEAAEAIDVDAPDSALMGVPA